MDCERSSMRTKWRIIVRLIASVGACSLHTLSAHHTFTKVAHCRTFVVCGASKILPLQDYRSHPLARYPKSAYRKPPTSNFAFRSILVQPSFPKVTEMLALTSFAFPLPLDLELFLVPFDGFLGPRLGSNPSSMTPNSSSSSSSLVCTYSPSPRAIVGSKCNLDLSASA